MFKKTKTFAKATCILCGAYTCIHVGQALSDPFNRADATAIPIAQVSSDTGATYYDITTAYVANLEVYYRTDMPWEHGFMITKRST
jgi:hypothetical protein